MEIYIDGKFYPEEQAKVSVFDHGLLYGDGIFEGIRVYGGRIFREQAHLVRLYQSAKAILLEIPVSFEEMRDLVRETVQRNQIKEGYIRLLVTRGKGTLGLSPDSCERASIICIAADIQLYPQEFYQTGLKVVTCATRRPTPASLPPQVKSLNYLNNVMARVEAQVQGAQEGLMLNEQGYVAECTGDNIFCLIAGKVVTPPIYSGALDGITRQVVIEILAELGIALEEREMTRHDCFMAEEMFLSGTAAEVIPVRELDGRLIGDGKPGKLTLQVIDAYHEVVLRPENEQF